jgi:arabinogalactan oligomer/maltooligosaccharide transport system substrate-binding protein
MKRSIFSTLAMVGATATVLAACGSQPAAPAPTAAPEAPAATTAPEAPAATEGVLPISGSVTLWHAYGTGSAEEAAINTLIDNARAAYPEATIEVLQIPFDQIFTKFQNEVISGGGPDVFVAPNDSLGTQVRSGLLAPLDEYTQYMGDISPAAIDGMTVNGSLYAVPESFKAVALYYNKSKVATPPSTTAELLAAVQGGNTLVLNQSAYHNFGWLQAFGGQLMDENGVCVADQAGGTEWLQYLADLKAEANVTFSTDGGQADSLFREGRADMIINGPWALGDYKAALGDDLGVAPMPGADQPAGPLNGVDGFYVNVNTPNKDGAVALGLFLVSTESMQVYVDQAGHVPANTAVTVNDELVAAFTTAAQTGVARPQVPELDNFWGPFGDAITKVVDGGADPATEIAAACTTMNTANGK